MVNSSDSVPEASSESVSLNALGRTKKVQTVKAKHERRTILVNTPFKQSKTLILYVNMHGSVKYPPHLANKCTYVLSPFNLLYRFIAAAPGETELYKQEQERELQERVDFDSKELTPEMLVRELKTITTLDDTNPMVVRNGRKNDYNFGYEKRHHTIINYKDSPYCFKTWAYQKDLVSNVKDISAMGIYAMNSVRTGLKFEPNLIFDKRLIKWLTTHKLTFQPGGETFQIKDDKISLIANDILFLYLSEHLKIKKLFLIDFSCEGDPKNLRSKYPPHIFLDRGLYDAEVKPINENIETIKNLMMLILSPIVTEDNLEDLQIYKDDKDNEEEFFTETNHCFQINKTKLTQNEIEEFETLIEIQKDLIKDRNKNKFYPQLYEIANEIKKKKIEKQQLQLDDDDDHHRNKLEKEIKYLNKLFYDHAKGAVPSVRTTKKIQAFAKPNKRRWHITKKGDVRMR